MITKEKGTCGNIMAAVGTFAVDEGYVKAAPHDQAVQVSIYKTNIKKMLHSARICYAGRNTYKSRGIDITAKMLSMGKFHRTFAGSGLYCLAAASLLKDTKSNRLTRNKGCQQKQIIRIGHLEGVAEVNIGLTADDRDVSFVGLNRTARRIMKGDL
ncbi:PrpF domain-containing protein [Bacillus sonorensis]|uniref:PrpF domain-containing protein n=1 Tax=Bacillus sonorensis TaxID=119858 RepID=UPI002282B4AF|nr:PrpF domain-containing protein [Bacillus sonorensis]MEC1534601.1 PrpF domain-containing protein [Bacillus sonorensis]